MASKSFGQALGLFAVLTLAPSFAIQTASAGETELVVIVTPYIVQPTKPNGSQTMPVIGKPFKTNPDSQNQASPNGMTLDGASGKSRQ
jgi:hypothetical protein